MSYYGRAEWTERAAALEAAAALAQQARALDERLASVERTLDEIAMRRSPRRAGREVAVEAASRDPIAGGRRGAKPDLSIPFE